MAKKKLKEGNIAVAAKDLPKLESTIFADWGNDSPRTGSSGGIRRNRAATIEPTDRYIHLESGLNPFYTNRGAMMADMQRPIQLSMQAWWNVPIVRNAIEISVELSDSRIYMKGGNAASKNFIGSWFKRIQLDKLKEQFFREYYRSGNIFLYRFDADFSKEGIKTLSEVYGASPKALSNLPIRYVLMNPARIRTNNTIVYQNSQYFQMITPIEMNSLKSPKSEQEKMLYDSLSPEIKKQIKDNIIPYLPLDQDRLYPIFSKKQDYEPFAVPFMFPVLEAVNAHIEMQRMDQALARTLDRAILLITNGTEPDKGGINPQNLQILNNLFKNESVARTLVADYTTKGQWLIPDLEGLLGSEKYEELNRQINIGLNSLFFDSNDKFANTSIKTQIFIERLQPARKAFTNFLQNEINRICKLMNFKVAPEIYFEDIQLKNETDFIRLFTRMVELGILTPNQFFKALDTGELPDTNTPDYLNEIKEYQAQRTEGLFLPLVGASMQDPNGVDATGAPGKPSVPNKKSGTPAGRPTGSKAPQTTKKISPIGASISAKALKDNTVAASELVENLEKQTKKKNKLKELNEEQKHVCELMAQSIMLTGPKEEWSKSIPEYLKSFKSPSDEIVAEVESLANSHEVSMYEATLLYLSRIES